MRDQSEKELEESITRVEGRYQEAIPWKYDGPVLPDKMALRRFLDIEKRFMKNSEWEWDLQQDHQHLQSRPYKK